MKNQSLREQLYHIKVPSRKRELYEVLGGEEIDAIFDLIPTDLLEHMPEKDKLNEDWITSVMAWHEGWNQSIDDCKAIINQRLGGEGE